jgi:hypothetical protein
MKFRKKVVTIIVLQRCVKTETAAGNGAWWSVQNMTTSKQRLVIIFHHTFVVSKRSFQQFFPEKSI